MVAGLTSGDGYTWMNPLSVFSASPVLVMNPLSVFSASLALVMNLLSVFSASLVLVLSKEKKLMILRVHEVMTDSRNLVDCANDFVGRSHHCLSVFGKFC